VRLDALAAAWSMTTVARRARDSTTTVLMALAVLVWVVAGYFAVRANDASETDPSAAGAGSGSAAPGLPPTSDPGDKPATSATVSASASASAPAKTVDPSACVADALATEGIDYGFICKQTNPLKAAGRVKSALVRNGAGLVTDGMRQWAGLGWYEMAAFTALRAHCCPPGEELAYNFTLACPLDEAVNLLDTAVRTGDAAKVEVAVKRYSKESRCLDQFGQSRNMGRDGPPGAGIAALKRLLEKIVGAP
jgi:eukaryotic-like serine/threonine-protein kinase